jgi:hypothetical protein
MGACMRCSEYISYLDEVCACCLYILLREVRVYASNLRPWAGKF